MSAVFAVLCFLVALVLSLALLAFGFTTLGFAGEAYRRGMSLPLIVFFTLAILIAATPLFLTFWTAWRRFFSSKPWEDVRFGVGLPLLACVVCAGATLLFFFLGEWVHSLQGDARSARELAALRAEVDGGAVEKSCDVVLTDPKATAEDMRRCRARIESLTDSKQRWAELQRFLQDTSGFKTWNPGQFGLAPAWDWNRNLVVVRHDQEWFIRTFYGTWLAQPGALEGEEELNRLQGCLMRNRRWFGWTPAALDVLRTEFLPEIVRRIEPLREAHRDMYERKWLWETIEKLQSSSDEGGGPPVPKLDNVPEDAIGLARFDADGTLRMWMRATPTTGAFGDIYLEYSPSDSHYSKWKWHLDSTEPGEVQPVSPL